MENSSPIDDDQPLQTTYLWGRDATLGGRAQEPDELIGTTLDVYEIHSLLGQGAMGRVYLAHHCDLHRPCALKILSPKVVLENEDYVTRFMNEGRAAAALNHPNVVTIHAIGEHKGFYFLEMEFMPGRSLQGVLKAEKRIDPIRATRLAWKMAQGLAAAHSSGIVHRDLKPDNVMLSHLGEPKLVDFGLAKRLRGTSLVPEGLMGTPHFMAPELFRGHSADVTSDVYALGVSYYIMLTGQFPYHAETLNALMNLVLAGPAVSVRKVRSEIPLEMSECVSVLMDPSPANRPKSALEAAQYLEAILGQVQDLSSLLCEAFSHDAQVTFTTEEGRYRIHLRLPDQRHQVVYVEESRHGLRERLLLIYSICCQADPAYYEFALRLNAEILHGGISLRTIQGKDHFVMVDTYPRGTVDAEEIRKSVHEVAVRADSLEKLLTGRDVN